MGISSFVFEYEIKLADLIQFNWTHMRKSKAAQRGRLMFLAFFVILWAVLFRNPTAVLLTTLIYALFIYLVLPILIPLQVYITYKHKQCKQMLGKMHVEFNEECIKEKTEVSESKIEWKSINSVLEAKRHIFVYNSSISALIIPKAVFNGRNEIITFIEQIKAKIAKAGNEGNQAM